MSDLVKNGFINIVDYQFNSKSLSTEIEIDDYIDRMKKLKQEINSIQKDLQSFNVESKKANLKHQADECRNAIKNRNKLTLIFYAFIWGIFYLALAGCNTYILVSLLVPNTNKGTIIFLIILYLIAIIVFNSCTNKIVKTPEREDWESDNEYDITIWQVLMCIPVLSNFAALGFFYAARVFYESISSATRRYERKEQYYLSQMWKVDYAFKDLERKSDELWREYGSINRKLQKICCCQYCSRGIRVLESNRILYSCTADNNRELRDQNCICNVKRIK